MPFTEVTRAETALAQKERLFAPLQHAVIELQSNTKPTYLRLLKLLQNYTETFVGFIEVLLRSPVYNVTSGL